MKKDLIRLGILASILVVAILLIKFLPEPDKKDKKNSPKEKKLFSINREDIKAFTIKKISSEIHIVRDKSLWTIVKPQKLEADENTILSFTRDFARAQGTKISTPGDSGKFGLKDPAFSITVRLKDNKTITLYRGAMAPSGEDYYAKSGDSPEIYLIKSGTFSSQGLDKSLKDFRNKDFLKLKEESISHILVNNVLLTREKDRWLAQGLKNDQDHQKKTSELVNHILNIKAQDFPDDHNKTPKIEFKDPINIEITTDQGKRLIQISRHRGKTYARVSDRAIYEISYSLFNNIQLDSEYLHKKIVTEIPANKKKQ